MKSCIVIGSWSDGVVAVIGPFPTADDAHAHAKGEKLLGNIREYVVKPFKSPPMKVVEEIQVFDGEEGT